ncbi:HD domain-containing phosphohydrolase [Paenibacillus hexagrammi]|uniref:Response regulator n=1 Tax=Paenibacillus hexagrammi TaxID=2908839 RepID=A0ABY3SHX3_9BACL|nr:HD domain-containing phosphohydrolase [Paenibacillus sp. YPD9-1]UJF32985.1 response regulator [Paenibacillus sp. YPD9-1]
MYKVVIADDRRMIRQGLRILLSGQAEYKVIGEARDGDEAVEQCLMLVPDLLLSDLKMPGTPIIEAVKFIKEKLPNIRIVILTAFDESEDIYIAAKAGVDGYIMKDTEPEQILRTLAHVMEGATIFQPKYNSVESPDSRGISLGLNKLQGQSAHQLFLAMLASLATIACMLGSVYWIMNRTVDSLIFCTGFLVASLLVWGMYALQLRAIRVNPLAKHAGLYGTFLFILAVSVYNPMNIREMWVLLLSIPLIVSLITSFRYYLYASAAFLFIFFIFNFMESSSSLLDREALVLSIILKHLFALGSVALGLLIQHSLSQLGEKLQAASFQKQKQQVIHMLECFISVGERKTQTSRKEIGEMSTLLKALVKEHGEVEVHEWEIDFLSLLHFVSRVKLPDYMFEKEGRLSEFEFEVVKEHCFMAKELCQDIADFQFIQSAFLYHHEKVDGTGYPYQLKGDEIPLLSQMLGLVEVFQAMTTPRSYRQAMSEHEAYEEIQKLNGLSFREDIIKSLGKVIS